MEAITLKALVLDNIIPIYMIMIHTRMMHFIRCEYRVIHFLGRLLYSLLLLSIDKLVEKNFSENPFLQYQRNPNSLYMHSYISKVTVYQLMQHIL